MPPWPPSSPPNASSAPVSVPSSSTVLRLFTGSSPGHVDFDLLRTRVLPLGKNDLQHAFLVLGLDLRLIDGAGKLEGSGEHAVRPLDAVVVLLLDFLGEPPLAPKRERVVLDPHIDVLLIDPGQVGAQHHRFLGLVNIHRGRPGPQGHLLIAVSYTHVTLPTSDL